MGDLEGMSSCGKFWKTCSSVGPILLCLIWLYWSKPHEEWCPQYGETLRWNREQGNDGVKAVTSWRPHWTREVEFEEAKAPVGVVVTLVSRELGLLGNPPSIAYRKSHREWSCPAMTDGETNDLWNSISCERHSKAGAASTIVPCHARPQQMTFSWLREPQITLLIEMCPQVIPKFT